MNFLFWLSLIGVSVLSFFSQRGFTVAMIKNIGVNPRYYPKWYFVPKRWMRKLFKIGKEKVPKCLYGEFHLAIIYAILEPINCMIYLCVGGYSIGNIPICGILIMLHMGLVIVDRIYAITVSM